MKSQNTSAIILAAGLSSRMGFPKLSLKTPDGNPFVSRLVEQFCDFGCEEVIIVINPAGKQIMESYGLESHPAVSIAVNDHPESGRFGSIRCGLEKVSEETAVFIQNVDNPFARGETLVSLLQNLKQDIYVRPVYGGKGGHPVLLGFDLIQKIKMINHPEMKLSEFLHKQNGIDVEVLDSAILLNINTRDDFQKFSQSLSIKNRPEN